MKFEQLEQLIKIKECGSISKAALALHVAQSTLSTSIKNLEDELACQLVVRENKGVSLTPAGLEVYTQAKSICEQVYNMKKSIEEDDAGDMVLSVSNNYSVIGKDIFIDLYNKYNGKHCRFKIQECSVTETIENVASGVSEVGLVRFPEDNREIHLRTMKRHGVDYHFIEKKPMCVVVGENNPLYTWETETISIEHLSLFPFGGYYSEEADVIYERILKKNERVKENISVGSVEHLKEVIRKTDAFMLDVYKERDFNSEWYDGLRYIPIEPKVYCEFGWLSKKGKPMSKIATEYVDMLKKHFKEFWADKDTEWIK